MNRKEHHSQSSLRGKVERVSEFQIKRISNEAGLLSWALQEANGIKPRYIGIHLRRRLCLVSPSCRSKEGRCFPAAEHTEQPKASARGLGKSEGAQGSYPTLPHETTASTMTTTLAPAHPGRPWHVGTAYQPSMRIPCAGLKIHTLGDRPDRGAARLCGVTLWGR